MSIDMIGVDSSNMAKIGHDAENDVLRVEFKGGVTYDYQNVDQSEFEDLHDAGSVGSHFHQNIKTAKMFRKVD